jgi:hypothetical protein
MHLPNLIFQNNDCVIESNDEIQIYLPDWDNSLKLVFTGYVNTVSDENDGLEKRIRLGCEDVTKKMRVTRTNAYPSLSMQEAQGNTITPYEATWQDKSPIEVVRVILGRTFCNVFNDLSIFKDAQTIFEQLNSKKGLTKEENAFKALDNAIDTKIKDKYIEEIKGYDNTVIGYRGFKAKKSEISERGEVAFVVLGTNQPVWALVMGGGNYDFVTSDWKSNDQLIADIANSTFFEFYALPSGIIYFGPTNLKLPKLYEGTAEGKEAFNSFLGNYIFTSNKEVYVRKYFQLMDDRNIFTDLIVTGNYLEGGYTWSWLKKLIIGPHTYRRKFGVRMMAQETKPGLVYPESLEVYGNQRLWKQNAQLYSASLLLEGNSNLQPGNPCYIDRWTSVYYIDSVTHSFTMGTDYSTEINLKYRRKPLYILSFERAGGYTYGSFHNYLSSLVQKQEISVQQKNYLIENEDELIWGKIKMYVEGNRSSVGSYVEGSLIWDAIPLNLYPSGLQVTSYLRDFASNEMSRIENEYNVGISISKNEETKRRLTEKRKKDIDKLAVSFTGVAKSTDSANFSDSILLKTPGETFLKFQAGGGK